MKSSPTIAYFEGRQRVLGWDRLSAEGCCCDLDIRRLERGLEECHRRIDVLLDLVAERAAAS